MALRKTTNNRRRGHNFERDMAKLFRDIGYTYTKTSRQASRLLDESKVDLWGLPFCIQCKEGAQKNLVYSKVLSEMRELLANNFPPEEPVHSYPKIVIHKKVPFGKRRQPEDTLVVMPLLDFVNLLTKKDD